MSANSQPDSNGSNHQHCQVVDRIFFITRCHPSVLQDPIAQTLDLVALPIESLVESSEPLLVTPLWDHSSSALATQLLSDLTTAVSFIALRNIDSGAWTDPALGA